MILMSVEIGPNDGGQYQDHSGAIFDLTSWPLIGQSLAILASDWSIINHRLITASGSDDHCLGCNNLTKLQII